MAETRDDFVRAQSDSHRIFTTYYYLRTADFEHSDRNERGGRPDVRKKLARCEREREITTVRGRYESEKKRANPSPKNTITTYEENNERRATEHKTETRHAARRRYRIQLQLTAGSAGFAVRTLPGPSRTLQCRHLRHAKLSSATNLGNLLRAGETKRMKRWAQGGGRGE